MANSNVAKNSSKAWIAAIIITLACTTSSLVSNKFSPALTQLMEVFNITLAESSLVASVTGIGGIVLALPMGMLATKFGSKKLALTGLAIEVVAGLVGVFATNYIVLLVSRAIEGFGNALMMVLGPSVIALLFTKDKVGLPMGIQGVWNPLGGFVILLVAAPIMAVAGWQGLWWVGVVLAAIMFVLVWIFVPDDRNIKEIDKQVETATSEAAVKIIDVMKNSAIWLVAIVMMGYTFASVGIQGFAPTYLAQAANYSSADANLVSSVLPLGKMLGSIVAGVVMLRLRKKQNLLILVLALVTVMGFALFRFTGDTSTIIIVVFFLLTGFVMLFTPPTAQSITPELLRDPRASATAMGIIVMLQNIASFAAPTLMTGVVQANGGDWSYAGIAVAATTLVALCAAIALAVMLKRKQQQ